jgi:hypothetical protein
MEIVIQLRRDVASLVSQRRVPLRQLAEHHPEIKTLSLALERMGGDLRPMHLGTADETLQKYFSVQCGTRDPAACEQMADTIRQEPIVEAAYVKPDAEPAAP